MKPKTKKWLVVLGSVLLVGVALALWAFVIEPRRLTVRHETLALGTRWPSQLNGLKIVLLSDLHIGAPHVPVAKMARIVELANAEQPDLILLAGDFVVGHELGAEFVPQDVIAQGLKDLRAKLGVYAVLGNHDWWEDGTKMRDALEGVGIKTIDNRALRLTPNGQPLWLIGLGDFWTMRPDITGTLAQVTDNDAPIIALTHNPDVFPDLPERITLTTAGHTHGGQVWLPIVGRYIVPSQYRQRYAVGHVQEGAKHLYVTPGIGTSVFPVRFLTPPEITVLTLMAG